MLISQHYHFVERDHLTRIHLAIGLQDMGFVARECGDHVIIATTGASKMADSGLLTY